MEDKFHCRACNHWFSLKVRKTDAKGREICASCLHNKKPPSMTRQNEHDDKYYAMKQLEKDMGKKPILDDYDHAKGRVRK